jgi:hypothetical protein
MTKQKQTKKAGSPRKASKTSTTAKAAKAPRTKERDPRLPAAGTTLVRPYKGKEIRVKVLEDGFEYEGKPYRSLTGIALVVTGYPACSGPNYFKLTGPAAATPKARKTKAKAAKEKPDVAPAAVTEAPASEEPTSAYGLSQRA